MPRINIEPELYGDWRFKRLVKKLGDEDRAVGMLARFWLLAQKYWGHESLIPFDEFEGDGFDPLVEVKLAEVRPDGVYAKGSEERFAWYLQACLASKKGGEATKQKYKSTSGGGPESHPRPAARLAGSGEPASLPLLSSPFLSSPLNTVAIEVIEHLNKVGGKNYRPKSHADIIEARLAEGFTKEQLIEVVDRKTKQWGLDPKMHKFLRPGTLFRASNFENYINEGETPIDEDEAFEKRRKEISHEIFSAKPPWERDVEPQA